MSAWLRNSRASAVCRSGSPAAKSTITIWVHVMWSSQSLSIAERKATALAESFALAFVDACACSARPAATSRARAAASTVTAAATRAPRRRLVSRITFIPPIATAKEERPRSMRVCVARGVALTRCGAVRTGPRAPLTGHAGRGASAAERFGDRRVAPRSARRRRFPTGARAPARNGRGVRSPRVDRARRARLSACARGANPRSARARRGLTVTAAATVAGRQMESAAPARAHSPEKPRLLDDDSREWLRALRATGAVREEGIARLHALLLRAARFEVARRRPALPHLRGNELDEIALEAEDDALMSVL